MYKIKYEVEDNSINLRYLEKNSMVIVTTSSVSQTSLIEAQSQLLLDFNIRQTINQQKKWSSFQHNLRQIFTNNIIMCKMIPNCILKINVFIVMAATNIQSAIINAVWTAMLGLGIPMQKSVMALESDINNAYVVNIFKPEEVIYGQSCKRIQAKQYSQSIQNFKNVVLRQFHSFIN